MLTQNAVLLKSFSKYAAPYYIERSLQIQRAKGRLRGRVMPPKRKATRTYAGNIKSIGKTAAAASPSPVVGSNAWNWYRDGVAPGLKSLGADLAPFKNSIWGAIKKHPYVAGSAALGSAYFGFRTLRRLTSTPKYNIELKLPKNVTSIKQPVISNSNPFSRL